MSDAHSSMHSHVIETERCGKINVYVQGDLENARKGEKGEKPIFLTVHDIGKNHHSWKEEGEIAAAGGERKGELRGRRFVFKLHNKKEHKFS